MLHNVTDQSFLFISAYLIVINKFQSRLEVSIILGKRMSVQIDFQTVTYYLNGPLLRTLSRGQGRGTAEHNQRQQKKFEKHFETLLVPIDNFFSSF